jgi:N6-adenosine-specific RNA methylase IME4
MTHYDIIVADPAWSFSDNLKKMKRSVKRSASSQYSVMSTDDIASMNVPALMNPAGCLLALWVPGSMLEHGLKVMHAWGFTLKQTFIWVKLKKNYAKEQDWNRSTRVGMGRLFRQSHEIALICTSGKSIYPLLNDKSQRSVAFDLNAGHSIKPATLQKRLEIMFPNANRLELFARRNRSGWVCLGDAVTGLDINQSIADQVSSTNISVQIP